MADGVRILFTIEQGIAQATEHLLSQADDELRKLASARLGADSHPYPFPFGDTRNIE